MEKKAIIRSIFKRTAAVICSAAMLMTMGSFAKRGTSYAAKASTDVSDEIGLVGNLFCISNENNADHAELQWATTLSADSFTLYRSTDPQNDFVPVYEGNGTSYEDDDMVTGMTYYYQLGVKSKGKELYS